MNDQSNQSCQTWNTPFWPEGVSRTVGDYSFPVFKFLDDSAKKYPNNVFTVFNGAQRTYAQVKDTADRIANFLAGKGIKKGDKIAIFLPNLPQFPEILFGILKAGAIAVNCNPVYTAPELNHQLKDSQSKMVFCMDHKDFYASTVTAVKGTGVQTVIVCNIKSYLPKFKAFLGGVLGKLPKADKIEPGHLLLDDIVATASPHPPVVEINPEKDTAIMLYTGGTTGLPKGAELTHTNFTYNTMASHEWCRLVHYKGKPAEKLIMGDYHCVLGVLPWYHSFGLTGALLVSCLLGAKIVCIPDPRAGKPPFTEVLKTVQKYRCTFMSAVPTIFVAFANHPDIGKYDISSFLGCISGGAPLPPQVCKQFEDKTGSIIFEAYGLTETSPALTANPTFRETRKIGSIGFPLPETDIKILNLEDSTKEMPRGQDGEIAACGPQVMKGYWNRPDANEEVFVTLDGQRYFLTGDIGNIDENGYITITDRKKDMIIVGGFNVYPRDVEDILYTHPKVELTAVVGIPDERSGEKVKAFIKLKSGQKATIEEFEQFCKENMAGYKRPKIIEFRDEIPVSNVGKVLRRVLRDEHKQ
ncbi:MAG: long-chain fatty acid--CoA ligase [Proteobacteria bacterium]|nr:long-chain fatty acid--CoA ligase [Pseudomonadota bacterium]MBU1583179.1 long-chain fatty acid--CoA ligase [Pseudomonadota bacterium]MBU2454591.1 long-chain fatty acid--CoA ligase [Pseudomonadota bacterium]MBU2631558.1 long-chain fatty acid--CoA ligase [Pseudomonadota bacterium]